MKLKEKFYPYSDNEYSEKWVSAENCEDVADEFAIGFGEYLDSLTAQDMGTLSIKELLIIYKKENGL